MHVPPMQSNWLRVEQRCDCLLSSPFTPHTTSKHLSSLMEHHSKLEHSLFECEKTDSITEHTESCPVEYESEYRWQRIESADGQMIWYRKMDGMANFVLHWQHRFHNHGDVHAHGDLQLIKSQSKQQIKKAHLREAMRRMRSTSPFVALSVQQRSQLKVETVNLPATLQHLDLQVCLAYSVPRCEKDVQDWLDDIIVIHDSCEERDFASFFRQMSSVKRTSVNSLRVHLWESDEHRPARLVVEQSHVISDGIGALITFDEVVRFLAMTLSDPSPALIEWGSEVSRLPPSLQDAIASPPSSWKVNETETRHIERDNRARMTGKAHPNIIDNTLDRVLELTLANNASGSSIRKTLNWPLARLARSVAQSGTVFPVGLLPSARKPYSGPWTFCDYMEDIFSKSDTSKLLAGLKRHNLTLAPFVETAMAFATTWIRRQRGLTDGKDQWDGPSKMIGSFGNAVSKRGDLKADHKRYMGLAMVGIVTKISASQAQWSQESLDEAVASVLDLSTLVPCKIERKDMESVLSVTKTLASQYKAGREDTNWLKYYQATMFGTMQAEYLMLSNEAYYPSNPWLSSVGNLDAYVARSRPVGSSQSEENLLTTAQTIGSMQIKVSKVQMTARNNLAQVCCHIYSYDGQMTFTLSFPDWLYNTNSNGRESERHGIDYSQRPNIVPVWYSIVKMILYSLIDEPV